VPTLHEIANSADNNKQHTGTLFTRRAKHIRSGEAIDGQQV